MYAVAMYLSKYARLALSYASEPVKGAVEGIFGKPVRILPDGATLWHTPDTSWGWEDDHPLVKFLRSLNRDKGEVFEVLFLEDASDRVVHEYNLRPDEDEKLGTKVSFTFMQGDFFKEPTRVEESKRIPPICKNCQFWSFTGKNFGRCQLNPPVVVNDVGRSYWPGSYGTDWCGQFKPRRAD